MDLSKPSDGFISIFSTVPRVYPSLIEQRKRWRMMDRYEGSYPTEAETYVFRHSSIGTPLCGEVLDKCLGAAKGLVSILSPSVEW